ncbi:universal stress protein [Mycobacterium sp.]|uniref:universal stress protein n=1 Tax=Mycobacterium sp. TaxID=1785 RepID=UPI00127063B3|nr:universal stress protein [Mycobacterium sp.]KAA8964645.1 MAG: universal stress protein [Mycobacterium sp.]
MRVPHAPPVVVGVDGSRSARQAALWAIDEAIDRDVPLQLVYAVEAAGDDHAVTAAEHTINDVIAAVESTGKPVKVEADVVYARPAAALLTASRSAALVCVGSTGVKHALQGRIGSTATALAASAHCPVAIVPTSAVATPRAAGLILAAVDQSPATSAVLELGVQEARLRGAALRIVTIRRRPLGDGRDVDASADHGIGAKLDHRLTHWRRNYPDLDIELVTDHHGLLNYLEQLQRAGTPIQLVVVDPLRPGPTDVLLGPSGRAALDATVATLLICDRQWWL